MQVMAACLIERHGRIEIREKGKKDERCTFLIPGTINQGCSDCQKIVDIKVGDEVILCVGAQPISVDLSTTKDVVTLAIRVRKLSEKCC
jgi:hypothetical protein